MECEGTVSRRTESCGESGEEVARTTAEHRMTSRNFSTTVEESLPRAAAGVCGTKALGTRESGRDFAAWPP